MNYNMNSKCNCGGYCFDEYNGKTKACIRKQQPDCNSIAVIPTVTVENIADLNNLTNVFVHTLDTNTTYYFDDKGRPIITWAGPVNIPGYDMENNPNGYKDQIITDTESGRAVIYDNHGVGYVFGVEFGDLQLAVNNKLDEMLQDGTLADIISQYLSLSVVLSHDNVASMKADTEITDGSVVETLGFYTANDGGSAMYKIREITNNDVVDEKFIIEIGDGANNLVAELITPGKEVNILQVGGSGEHLAPVCNYLIAKGYDIYIPRGDYVLTETINVSTSKTKLTCNGNISSADVTNYFLINSNDDKITLNGVIYGYLNNSNEPVPTLMTFGNATNGCQSANIYIKQAENFDKGIVLSPDNHHGVAYCNIKFDRINAITGILFKTGDVSNNYVNENYFEGGRLYSIYGIVFTKGANQTDNYNGNIFDHIAIERDGIVKALDLNYASFNNFNDMRISEGLTGSTDPIHIGEGCRDNIIQTKYQLRTEQITDDNTTSNYIRNYFNTCYVTNDLTRIGRNFYTYKGKVVIDNANSFINNIPIVNNATDTNEDSTETLPSPEYILNGNTIIKLIVSYGSVNKTFKLPLGMDQHSINRFVLLVAYKENNSSITLQDYDGNSILESSRLGTAKIQKKMYYVEYTGNGATSGINAWKLTEIV